MSNLYGDTAPLTTVFGWNTVINLFYIPGTMLGAPASDWLGPRYALALGVTLQAVVGFIMAGDYFNLSQPGMVGGFVVVYGVFLALGEFGPGNNIGLLAAKTCATGIRGRFFFLLEDNKRDLLITIKENTMEWLRLLVKLALLWAPGVSSIPSDKSAKHEAL